MRNWIEIDGVMSRCMGLKMERLPLWPVAEQQVSEYEIPGAAEKRSYLNGLYSDFELELTGYLTRPPCSHELARLNKWLANGRELVMSTQPDLVGKIRRVGQIVPTRIGTRANAITLPLTFEPFKYDRRNETEIMRRPQTSCQNYGNIYCEPVYKLCGISGGMNAAITVNGIKLTILLDVTGDAYIDVPRRKIYQLSDDGTLTVMQHRTFGSFWDMVLQPGYNEIMWTYNIDHIEITKNERWL